MQGGGGRIFFEKLKNAFGISTEFETCTCNYNI